MTNQIIDLPKSQYQILNAPAPGRWQVVIMIAGIMMSVAAFAVLG